MSLEWTRQGTDGNSPDGDMGFTEECVFCNDSEKIIEMFLSHSLGPTVNEQIDIVVYQYFKISFCT